MAFEHEDITGDYRGAMRQLVGDEDHFRPADARWEMERRVDAVDKFKSGNLSREELLSICNNYRNTGDGIVRMANGEVKIKPRSPALLVIAENAKLINGGLGHDYDPYPEVSPIPVDVVERDFNRRLAKDEAETNEGLLQLAGGDKRLVVAHDGAIRYVRGEVLGLDAELVSGIYVHKPVEGFNVERAAVLDRFDCDFNDGRGGGYTWDLYLNARLARVAPEALDAPRSGAPGAASSRLDVGGLTDHLYRGFTERPMAEGVTKKFLREQILAYQRTLK